MKKMGNFEDNMDSRIPSGSVSSASGYSLRSRGPSANISPFCPRSSSKLTQSIIKDHMVSHYKKVYSAKAAIDTSVPKSLLYSVKYNDQLKREQLRKSARPQSAHSLLQRSRVSCSPAQSRLSLQYEDSHYPCSRSSLSSTPRPSTSFHPKNIVYPSFKEDFHRPTSETKHQTLEASLRLQSAYSLEATGDNFKSFQDPAQKTYSGDLIQKHSLRFTDHKPFTPKTLKSDKSSYLSKYRYYRAPQKKSSQNSSNYSNHQEALHKSTSNEESTQEIDQRSQGFITDYDLSVDNFNDSYLSESRHNLTSKNRERDMSHSFSSVSHEGRRSPMMKSVNAEEEELKYLEFITAVTDDILSRGFISDGVVERVINRHIDMNRYHLDEGKMRHLLEVLRKDLQQPTNSPVSTLNLEREENHLLDRLLLQKDDLEGTKENKDHFQYELLVKNSTPIDYTDPILTSTLMSEHKRTSTPTKLEEKCTRSPQLSKHSSFSEESIHQKQPEIEENDNDIPVVLKELDEIGAALESLNVSDHSHCDNTESEEQAKAAISDDEF